MHDYVSPRVLVVDDDVSNRHLVSRYLIDAGYNVRTANDGEQCLSIMQDFPADLVILDVLMPCLGGFETCRRVRANPRFADIPILFLTAVDERDASDAALRSGGDDYLPKPFRRLQLLLRVQNLLTISARRKETEANLRAVKMERDLLARAQNKQQLLTSMAVHDLKGPIAAVVSNASYLDECVAERDLEPHEAIKDVIRAAERMRSIIGQALTPSTEGTVVALPTEVTLDELVSELSRAHRDQRVVANIAASANTLTADRDLLLRVFENLLDNARKYAPSSPVYIDAVSTQAEVIVRVRDEGPGIPPEERQAVFEARRRLERDRANSTTESAGLGLSFCRMVAQAHTGSLHIEDNEPCGTTFVLRLPRQGSGEWGAN